jgi:hypothetical protein
VRDYFPLTQIVVQEVIQPCLAVHPSFLVPYSHQVEAVVPQEVVVAVEEEVVE